MAGERGAEGGLVLHADGVNEAQTGPERSACLGFAVADLARISCAEAVSFLSAPQDRTLHPHLACALVARTSTFVHWFAGRPRPRLAAARCRTLGAACPGKSVGGRTLHAPAPADGKERGGPHRAHHQTGAGCSRYQCTSRNARPTGSADSETFRVIRAFRGSQTSTSWRRRSPFTPPQKPPFCRPSAVQQSRTSMTKSPGKFLNLLLFLYYP